MTDHLRTTCALPVFFATTEGQTRLIAERLAARFREQGFDSRAIDLGERHEAAIDWASVRAVAIGGSLHAGAHQREVATFVARHAAALNARPSLFFSVSLAAGSKNPAEVRKAAEIAETFAAGAGWTPTIVATVAGRLAYTKYGSLKRWAMRRIAAREGGPTDTSRDWEFTDWAQVDALARELTGKALHLAA